MKHLGPLWTHSCFPFEDKNKFILQLIHGSQKIECQLNSAINVIQSIPNVVEKTISENPLLMSFYQSMNRQKYFPASEPIAADTFILGKASLINFSNDLFTMLSDYFDSSPIIQNIMLYLGETYHAKSYQQVSHRNSTVICYSSDGVVKYGCIQLFILYKQQNRKYLFAKVKELSVVNKNEISHIVMIRNDNCEDKLIIAVDNILYKMLRVDYPDSIIKYLCRFFNQHECC